MMNDVRSWLAKVRALLDMVLESQTLVDQLSVRKHFALAEDRPRLELKLAGELAREMERAERMIAVLWQWTGCSSVEQVSFLLTDIQVRVTAAAEALHQWRSYVAQAQFLREIGCGDGTESLISVSGAEEQAELMRAEYELHMTLLKRMIPPDSGAFAT